MKILKTFKKDNIIFKKDSLFTGSKHEALAINNKVPNAIEIIEEKPKVKRQRRKKA